MKESNLKDKIKQTPILDGKDAKLFMSTIKKNEFQTISVDELEKMRDNFKKLNKIAKF